MNQLIVALHAAPAQWVLVLTGGGASAAAALLSVPGGSRTLLEIVVPYCERSLAEFIGRQPESSCSAATSQAMARQALARARWLAPGEVFGLASTASLVSDRPKRGDHRVHVSTAGRELLRTWSLTLNKGARDRFAEDNVVAGLIFHAMAQTLGLNELASIPLLPGEKIDEVTERTPLGLACRDNTGPVLIGADGQVYPAVSWDEARPWALVPGAFNPLHGAHLALAAVAERLEGKPAAFELSVVNVDKPELSTEEVRRRLGQFVYRAPIWLTRAPRFVDKAALFPRATFVVGADTAERLVATHYYQDDEHLLRQALDLFRRQRCRFLVAGRAGPKGDYLALDGIAIPEDYRDLFHPIAPEDFRMDVSSTALRERAF